MPFDELLGWQEFFRRRPVGWREDNRAAVIAQSFGGSKLKPEDLFYSLRELKRQSKPKEQRNWAVSLLERFVNKTSDPEATKRLLQEEEFTNVEIEGFIQPPGS